MKIMRSIEQLPDQVFSVLTIGKFDGLHRGHQTLIDKTVSLTSDLSEASNGKELIPVVLAFDMSAIMILSSEERRRRLEQSGISLLIEQPFDPSVITMEAEDFIKDILVGKLHIKAIVIGEGFRFGYGRRGDAVLLKKMGSEYGFDVVVMPQLMEAGERISSSRIRSLLKEGKIEEVNACLGYSFYITGKIIHGRRIGRTIGVPTANLIADPSKLMPPNGVYMSHSTVGGRDFYGVTNVGTKPTVDGHFIGVETCFFNCDEDLYGSDLSVKLLRFTRPERKFDSLEQLKEQIRNDQQTAREYFHLKIGT